MIHFVQHQVKAVHFIVLSMFLSVASGCGGGSGSSSMPLTQIGSSGVDSRTPQPTPSPSPTPELETASCRAPEGMEITDINSVTDWINALPKPVTMPCFVQSLPRPLHVNFTNSVFSAQPALGKTKPRMFIFYDDLILSVVTFHDDRRYDLDEDPVDLMEFSFFTNRNDSDGRAYELSGIKGEYQFPYSKTIAYEEPFAHIARATGTPCGGCHKSERIVDESSPYKYDSLGNVIDTNIFESAVIQSREDLVVSVKYMKREHALCDAESEPVRCEILDAIFGHGDVIETDFPKGTVTF